MNKKEVVPKLRQEVKVKGDIVTSDDIKIYYTGKFQNFTAMYTIIFFFKRVLKNVIKRAYGELDNIFRDEFNKILSQQSTNVRFCLSHSGIQRICHE